MATTASRHWRWKPSAGLPGANLGRQKTDLSGTGHKLKRSNHSGKRTSIAWDIPPWENDWGHNVPKIPLAVSDGIQRTFINQPTKSQKDSPNHLRVWDIPPREVEEPARYIADMQTAQCVDPQFADSIITSLKFRGIFDKFRKDCLADVDTKPAYQNLKQRVETAVTSYLEQQIWRPNSNKNQLRDNLRKYMNDSSFLAPGIDRIVDQVVNPKMFDSFFPAIEGVVYEFLGLDDPNKKENDQDTSELLVNKQDNNDDLKYAPTSREKVEAWKVNKDDTPVLDDNVMSLLIPISAPVKDKTNDKKVVSDKKPNKLMIKDKRHDKCKDTEKDKIKVNTSKTGKDLKDNDKNNKKDVQHKSVEKVKSEKDRQKSKDDHGSHKKKSSHSDKKPDRDRDGKGSSSKHVSHKSVDKHRSSSTHSSKSSGSKDDKRNDSKDRKNKNHARHGSGSRTGNDSTKVSLKNNHQEAKSENKGAAPEHDRVTERARKEIFSAGHKAQTGEEGEPRSVAHRHSDLPSANPDSSSGVAAIPKVSIMEFNDSKKTSSNGKRDRDGKTASSSTFSSASISSSHKIVTCLRDYERERGGDEPPASNPKLKSLCENGDYFGITDDKLITLTAMYIEENQQNITHILPSNYKESLKLLLQESSFQQFKEDNRRPYCSYHDNMIENGLYQKLLSWRSRDYLNLTSFESLDIDTKSGVSEVLDESDDGFFITSQLSKEEVEFILEHEGRLVFLESQKELSDSVGRDIDTRRHRKLNTRYLSDDFAITPLKRKLSSSQEDQHSSKTYKKMCPPTEREHQGPSTPPYTNSQYEDDDLEYSVNNHSPNNDVEHKNYDYRVVQKSKLLPKLHYGTHDIILHFDENEVVNIEVEDPKKFKQKHYNSGLVLDGSRELINIEITDNFRDKIYSSSHSNSQRGGGDADNLVKGLEKTNSINGKNSFIHHQC